MGPPMSFGGVSSVLQYCMPTFVEYVMHENSRSSSFQIMHAAMAFGFIATAFVVWMEVGEVWIQEYYYTNKQKSSDA